ncbi:hypothetical protein GBF35_45905 [Nonomuraea phyllanthi]|uniref:hypothetical protein n=1 Tax=Nonomuraea phyllanthi TaxID=2219224 RepID=UPI00129373F0|nr:hypothetical protein [Nonomuraea phyllanthi]QFY12925.1 hypothetical protein GBF35_45905 [Nonomuraea phyllanthi]
MFHTRSQTTTAATTEVPRVANSDAAPFVQEGPLRMAERSFALLMQGPQPLAVDGAALGLGLPARLVPFDELRTILLHPSCDRTTRDGVWRHLIEQARTHRGAWMVAAVALAVPMLRRLLRTLTEMIDAEHEDIEAEMLACFMEALHRVELSWSHPVLRLSRLTQFGVLRAHAIEQPELLSEPEMSDGRLALRYPSGHPDLLLARAVEAGIITAGAAELIGTTRLDSTSLADYCRARGLLYCTELKRRQRAEARLRQALISGELSGTSEPSGTPDKATRRHPRS